MFYTFFVILKQGEKMLKQIAFGGIALTATGYGIKKLYEKLSKPERKFDTHAIVPSCKDMINTEEYKLKRELEVEQKKNQIQEFLCECMECYSGFSKYFNSKEFLEFEQNFTSKNNHKTEFLLSSYKDQMIKVIDYAKKFECLSAFLETQSEKNDLAVVKMISESMERKTQRFYLQTKLQTFPQYIFPSVWSSPMWNKQWE
ncbi:TPA: hypothetical protein SG137_000373 [Campylobacter jejuni]|nr:hypothetical protein [Campylobacter jejuni]